MEATGVGSSECCRPALQPRSLHRQGCVLPLGGQGHAARHPPASGADAMSMVSGRASPWMGSACCPRVLVCAVRSACARAPAGHTGCSRGWSSNVRTEGNPPAVPGPWGLPWCCPVLPVTLKGVMWKRMSESMERTGACVTRTQRSVPDAQKGPTTFPGGCPVRPLCCVFLQQEDRLWPAEQKSLLGVPAHRALGSQAPGCWRPQDRREEGCAWAQKR